MMHQHQMRVASSAGNKQQQQQQQVLSSSLQLQLSLDPVLGVETQALRVLPGGLGPWPLEQQLAAQADPAEEEEEEAGSSAAGAAVAAVRPAAAVAAAVHDKVVLLRCLLVYHLQASLLYDAQVGSAGACMHLVLH
jgi:hypothetical protein